MVKGPEGGDPASIEALFATLDAHGRVPDILVNTAAANDFTLNLDGGTLYSAPSTTNLIDNDGVTGSDITVLLGAGNTTIDTTSSSFSSRGRRAA